jgi:hypothetical protein
VGLATPHRKVEMEENLITIELHGKELDDGRFFVSSPNLEGFRYLLNADEEPETMIPSLTEFMQLYLSAEIKKLRRADTPKAFRQRIHRHVPRVKNYSFVAFASTQHVEAA